MKMDVAVKEETVRTICCSHCGGMCEVNVYVRDNKIVRIEPVSDTQPRHRPCARGRAYRQRVYAPDRLLYPLKRTGERGSGAFARISWEQAIDIIASEMKRIREAYGNASLLHFCSMADPYSLHHVPAIHKLLCQFGGYTAPWGTISNEGKNFSAGVTYGTSYIADSPAEDMMKAKLIILWSWNPAVTNQGSDIPIALALAKEKGARIVAVDPRFNDTAAVFADKWIPIKPSTDAAALIAMAYVIISEDLQDKSFIDKYTVGFEKFKEYVFGIEDGVKKTPEWAEKITGVPSATIIALAREFALTKPASLRDGLSAGRSAYGEQFHRAIATLKAITGNIDIPAESEHGSAALRALRRSVQLSSPPNPVETEALPRWNALKYRGASVNSSARVNVNLFADAILKGKAGGYPADYKFLWLSNTNYLNQLGDINKAKKAFQRLEFMLVTEQFMTASAQLADIVLPVCTYLERNDIYASRDGDSYGLVNKVIEPLGESKSQLQICQALAPKLGINDYDGGQDEELLKSMVGRLSRESSLPDYDALKKQGITGVELNNSSEGEIGNIKKPANKIFPTPSGKIEIYSQVVADMHRSLIPPVPKYIEPWEGPEDPLAKKYPFQLITPHFTWRAHSQFDNLPWLRSLHPHAVTISSLDAETKDIHDGDMVRVFNDRGEVRIPVQVTELIMPGIIEIPQGAWYKPDETGVDTGGCPNVLVSNRTSPAGAFTSSTTLVQIEKVEE
ncbi:MAG: molybdopterin-dependent oxidoreductase [Dehalococcoidales bacterium]|nr:molybdopterin-dependent oxidoreductase [Dehalococcoidales bacterium]